MQYRKFGTTDFEVSPIGLGCMGMSGTYGPADDDESLKTLHMAFDLGINFIDTSASYGEGHNQELIGKAIRGRRDKIVIHSKSGSVRKPDEDGHRASGTPDYLMETCEKSLKRLGIEELDIWCMSRVDPQVPIEESVGAMARLVEQGKCRYIALSEASAESIRRANTVHPIVSLQMEYSLFSRDPERGNIDACREAGMGFMAYGPLGRGFLAGLFHSRSDIPRDDRRHKNPRFEAGNFEHNARLLGLVEELANEKSATPAQISLAWLMAQGRDIVPIPGCKSRKHLEENIKAIDIELSAEDLVYLEKALPPGAAAGTRYPEANMGRVNI